MGQLQWFWLFGAIGQLTIVALCLLRGRQSPLARPVAYLCLSMFGWCLTSLVTDLTQSGVWAVLDSAVSAFSPPLAVLLTVTFVGARRAYAKVVLAQYLFFGALSLTSLTAVFLPSLRPWIFSPAWFGAYLLGWTPALILIGSLLVRHLVVTTDPQEKARTRLMLAAIALCSVLATNDIVIGLGFDLPHLAPIGALVSALLVATAVFRFRMLDRDLSVSASLYTAALAGAGVVAYLGVFRLLGGNIAALAFGTVTVTVALGAAVYEMSTSAAVARGRVERLVALGRFSSQMAHDLKNPLAALKGGLQFLKEERERGRSLDDQHEFLHLLLDQVDRLGRIADDYERVGRLEPCKRAVDLNHVVRRVVALEPFAANAGVAVRTELADVLPPCELDADLVSRALENLLRNAFEAMPHGGRVTVRTAPGAPETERFVLLSVQDEGSGMDARQAERAFDEFYTTKAQGSGLGLAFVKRVAQAHGGDARLETGLGRGTLVEMRIPTRDGGA